MSVFCAATGNATDTQSATRKANLRMKTSELDDSRGRITDRMRRPAAVLPATCDHCIDHALNDFIRIAELLRSIFAEAPLDLSVRETLRADRDSQRKADQIRVLEFDARTFV